MNVYQTDSGIPWLSEYTVDTLPDISNFTIGSKVLLKGSFAVDVTKVLLEVNYIKGVISWTGKVISAYDPSDTDGLPNGVTWEKV